MARGDIVLVPFPFTDLSGEKRRPALILSPDSFDPEDLVLCAITSRLPGRPGPWEIPLQGQDVVDGQLPRPSIIRAGKLFTMHRSLVPGRFGAIRPEKFLEVLSVLQLLIRP